MILFPKTDLKPNSEKNNRALSLQGSVGEHRLMIAPSENTVSN